jgi:diguanylate cyclase (GGDEF)-like protein
MQVCVRESDTVARIGGDEFVVLLPAINSHADALSVAEKIKSKLNESFEISENHINISASLGVAIYPDDGVDERELYQRADTAMYRAKQQGKNTVETYRGINANAEKV